MTRALWLAMAAFGLMALVTVQGAAPEESRAQATPSISVDTDSTGNTASSVVEVNACSYLQSTGQTTTLDLVIQGAGQVSTFGAGLQYDPTKLKITGFQMNGLFLGSSLFVSNNALPDTDGEFVFLGIKLFAPFNSGSGALARITVESVANGQSSLSLANVILQDGSSIPQDIAFSGPDNGTMWVGSSCTGDADADGFCDPGRTGLCTGVDNCPWDFNPAQTNTDGDGLGNACDPDDDNDGICDTGGPLPNGTPGTPPGGCAAGPSGVDNCPIVANPSQADSDADGMGDACDADAEADGIEDSIDGFMLNSVFQNQSTVFSSKFTDQHLGGTTFGEITDGQPLILVTNEANPAGVRISASAAGSVSGCGFATLGFTMGDLAVLTCTTNGFSLRTLTGPVAVVFDSILLSFPAPTLITVTETALDVFLISNDATSGTSLTVEQTLVPPGSSLTICSGTNDCDFDGVLDGGDNCRTVANGATQAGTPGVGNQTNTDVDLFVAGFRLGLGGTPPLIAPDSLGNACDADDDNDGLTDVAERATYAVGPGSVQELTPCRTGTVNDPWPPDFPIGTTLPDRVVDVQDMNTIIPKLFQTATGNERFNIAPDSVIDVQDLNTLTNFLFQSCTSPA